MKEPQTKGPLGLQRGNSQDLILAMKDKRKKTLLNEVIHYKVTLSFVAFYTLQRPTLKVKNNTQLLLSTHVMETCSV